MKTIRQADIWVGCFLTLLGGFIIWAASTIRIGVERALSPRFFPTVLGCVICAAGAGLALKAWRFRGEDPKIAWPDRLGVRIDVIFIFLLMAYIFLMKPLGLPIATFLYVTVTIWYLKPEKWVQAVAFGAIFGIISYVVFIHYLQLSFPVGSLLERIGLGG